MATEPEQYISIPVLIFKTPRNKSFLENNMSLLFQTLECHTSVTYIQFVFICKASRSNLARKFRSSEPKKIKFKCVVDLGLDVVSTGHIFALRLGRQQGIWAQLKTFNEQTK